MRSARFIASLSAVTLAIFGIVSPVRAEVCGGAVALRVNDSGLRFVAEQAKPFVPTSVALPAIRKTVVDWPLTADDAVVDIAALEAAITLHELTLSSTTEGAVRLYGRVDVTTKGPVAVEYPYAGFGHADCTANVQLHNLSLDVGIKLETVNGKISATVNQAKVDLDNPKSVIALEGCTLGDILTTVVDFVRGHFMGVIQSQVEKIAKEQIPAIVAEKLGDALELTRELAGFSFTGRLDALSTDQNGLAVSLGVGVELTAPPAACAAASPAPEPSCVGPQPVLPASGPAMFGAAVTETLLNRGLFRVWQSGLLCLDSDALGISMLSDGLAKLGPMLGQPPSTKLGFGLRLAKAPRLRMSKNAGLELVVEGLAVELRLTPAGAATQKVALTASLSIAVTPWIDPTSNSVALDLHHVGLESLAFQGAKASPLALDPARLSRFLAEVIVPLLRSRLSQTQLSPSLINVKGAVVGLSSFSVADGYLAVQLDAFMPKATGDSTAPDTLLRQGPGALVAPQVLSVQVEGRDNRTPTALLRYQYRVNGGSWTAPTYGGRLEVVAEAGVSSIEIAAVDEDGNIDSTPLNLPLMVDDAAPSLTITSRPGSLVTDTSATVSFSAVDDRTSWPAMTTTAQLLRVPDGGGLPTVVSHVTVPAGQRSVSFNALQSGVYKIRVIVADEAGNVTSEDIGFAVELASGCSSLPGTPGSLPFVGLTLLLLAAIRSRFY